MHLLRNYLGDIRGSRTKETRPKAKKIDSYTDISYKADHFFSPRLPRHKNTNITRKKNILLWGATTVLLLYVLILFLSRAHATTTAHTRFKVGG